MKAWGISADETTGKGKRTQTDVLLELASEAELWHSPEGEPYATVAVSDHVETVRVDEGRTFTRWIVGEFYRKVGKAPGTNALTDVRRIVAAMALHEEIKYLQDYDHRPPRPFDWAARLERTRRMIIERGYDPDEPYS